MELGGETVPVRPHLGIYTQPVSFIGLPVVSCPVHGVDRMPPGVQVIAAPARLGRVDVGERRTTEESVHFALPQQVR